MAKLVDWPPTPFTPTLPFPPPDAPPDWQQRERALDVEQSWIIEAPAGSGKTGLLIQRFLKLLAEGRVDRPEQILAITFTNAAAEEIRARLMTQLELAAAGTETRSAFESATRVFAEGALQRGTQMGWDLLSSSRRLNVRTIDSVCAEIARSLPVTTRGTADLTPIEDADSLYREAGRRTLLRLGSGDHTLSDALNTLLLHRDGNLPDCERLIAEMLAARDQWGTLVPLGSEHLSKEALETQVRPRLNSTLERAVCRALSQLTNTLSPEFLQRLTEAAADLSERPAHREEVSPLAICRHLRSAPLATAEHLDHWRTLIHLLLTPSSSTFRKRFNSNEMSFITEPADKVRLRALVDVVQDSPGVLEALCRVSALPPATYPQDQWVVAMALFHILNHALAELKVIFAERGQCDFAEPALLAREALRSEDGLQAYEAALGVELRHLLVDEMQDTSTSQYELIELLTKEWAGEHKTVFLVGDPKQSIYLFRQARVERFLDTMRTETLGSVPVRALRLTANFRSQAGLVKRFNAEFTRIFPASSAEPGEITFVEAQAVRPEAKDVAGQAGLTWHAGLARGYGEELSTTKAAISKRNAKTIRDLAAAWRSRPATLDREKPLKIAVLVRSRRELREIVAALKQNPGRIPFRAVKVDPLSERREVLDLFALTRALRHPADRVAWLAVLRSPWCGLDLLDLHTLTGSDDPALAETTVLHLIETLAGQLSLDGIERLKRIWPVLSAAVAKRSKLRLAELVERTWRSLGGDAVLTETELLNATEFLKLLDKLEEQTDGFDTARLDRMLLGLYAAPSAEQDAIELMTIHGAKGLEWDVVIVPELERRAPPARSRLLEWEEIEQDKDRIGSGVMLAPIAGRGEASEALNTWLRAIRAGREAAERKRLFYVACTRARDELHLFGTANVSTSKEQVKPESGSLLQAAWPAAEPHFVLTEAAPARLIERLAASSDDAPSVEKAPVTVERVPGSLDLQKRFVSRAQWSRSPSDTRSEHFLRPEGSFEARSFGNAVHAYLAYAAERLATGIPVPELVREVSRWKSRIVSVLRADGLAPGLIEGRADRVITAVLNTLQAPTGLWLLTSHRDAGSEYALTSNGDHLRRVRLDRVFRGSASPGLEGSDFLWIIDYKTAAHGASGIDAFLAEQRVRYEAQMNRYAAVLGEPRVRVGLWFPMISRLDWWIPEF